MPANPLVSILVANYNYAQFLPDALDSLVAQTYERIEVIVCDDGSSDASCEVVRDYASRDARFRLIQQANAGVGAALNTAYAAAAGDVICLLDADDYFLPQKVRLTVERIAEPEVGFALHAMQVVDREGSVLRRMPATNRFEEGWIADRVVRRGGRWRSMPASALAFHSEVAARLFPMPAASLRSLADAYLYMMAPLLTRVAFITEPLSAYRLHGANLTATTSFGAAASRAFVEGMERVHQSIEEKQRTEQYPLPSLDLSNHLTYREQRFLTDLFEGAPGRALWPRYVEVVQAIWRDDVYRVPRKVLGVVALGTAMGVPVERRPAWVTRLLGIGR